MNRYYILFRHRPKWFPFNILIHEMLDDDHGDGVHNHLFPYITIVLKDGKQVTEFQDGMLPWAYSNPVALVFDEYDAGRPDVMFVIQRILEAEGRLTLVDQSRIIKPNKYFRLFATTNTVGLGDTSGLYHGTQQINQGQMDRWNIISTLNYLSNEEEEKIILSKIRKLNSKNDKEIVKSI